MVLVEGWRLRAWGEEPSWEAVDVPDPGPGEVLVAVEACSVGLTVLNCMNGNLDDSPDLLPLTPGHEVVGRVQSVGDGVTSPAAGDRVVAYFYLACFRCRECLAGRESRCENLAGWYGVHRDGGYAPLSVMPAGNAVPLTRELPAADATVLPDAVATSVHVCKTRLNLRPGDVVAVVGAGGGVGAHMIQVARACGATVAGIERSEGKFPMIEELGAVPVAAAEAASITTKIGPPDAVIDLVGTRETLAWGLGAVRAGGRLCVLTTFPGVSVAVEPRALVFKESAIVGCRYASRSELLDAADLVASGAVRPVVGEVVGARDVGELHALLRSGSLHGRGALVWDRA